MWQKPILKIKSRASVVCESVSQTLPASAFHQQISILVLSLPLMRKQNNWIEALKGTGYWCWDSQERRLCFWSSELGTMGWIGAILHSLWMRKSFLKILLLKAWESRGISSSLAGKDFHAHSWAWKARTLLWLTTKRIRAKATDTFWSEHSPLVSSLPDVSQLLIGRRCFPCRGITDRAAGWCGHEAARGSPWSPERRESNRILYRIY